MNNSRESQPSDGKNHRISMASAGQQQEEFVTSENDSCSHVVRPDWPTRENDGMCSMAAAVVCSNSECDASLCILHEQRCDQCQQVFCDGCYADHVEVHGKKPSGREANPPEKQRYA
jgi:hypothetical protein